MKPISDNYWRNLGIILLIAAVIMLGLMQCATAEDVTYTTTTDGMGNLYTTGSDGSKAVSAKCQTCARPSYTTTYSDGTKSTTSQNATNDDYVTTRRK
jgi:hypothetical protein